MNQDIWILLNHKDGVIDDTSLALVSEAEKIMKQLEKTMDITAVVIGAGIREAMETLGAYGIFRALLAESEELLNSGNAAKAAIIHKLVKRYQPYCVLSVSTSENNDLVTRLAAKTKSPMATNVVDYEVSAEQVQITRPVNNGFLYEELVFEERPPYFLSFLPAVLVESLPAKGGEVEIVDGSSDIDESTLGMELIETIEADPSELALEEADVIVAAGRGVGKDEKFSVIHQLAKTINGSVGGTRPVIDWHLLEFERQIGQTGKTVNPGLIVNCGISGANEYTAGMEKSRHVIVIDKNPKARMFKFADLGVAGDVHDILPQLIEKINEKKASKMSDQTDDA